MVEKQSHIYSKIDYENAVSIKRSMLRIQENLLNSVKEMREYSNLRKKEFLLKIKLRNTLKETKQKINTTIKNLPETENIKQNKKQKSETEKNQRSQKKMQNNIEEQLNEIKRKLDELS